MEVDIADDIPCSSIAVDSVIRMGTAGLIWGSCSGPYDANKLGLSGINRASFIAKSVGRLGFQWGLFAAIFSSTRCGFQRYRRRNDWGLLLVQVPETGSRLLEQQVSCVSYVMLLRTPDKLWL
ncbi:outer envelope pore protein 16-4, chloroplastic isoform X2 [Solanum lycopersicum]|uniref:outer envelope pore protein 16-4, chloroplastic isoform X2 n=1 Tax=Solanum lycopersicum TaxID=4081 RepID=UPI0037491F1A